jgi:hypothetical protein
MISGCHDTEMGVCAEVSLGLRHQRSCMCSLSVTILWWRSSGGLFELVAGCASAWHNVGDDDACVGGLFRSSLPCG